MTRRRWIELSLACCATLALVAAPAAQAANIAPNPGFEAISCGPTSPCNWTPMFGVVASIDAGRNGGSSLGETTSTGGSGLPGVHSDCVVAGPGTYSGSFYYNVAASETSLGGAFLFAYAFTSADCASGDLGQAGFVRTLSPTLDGAWHQVVGTITVPAGAQSVTLRLHFPSQGADVHGSFDDVVFDPQPTAVAIASLTAVRQPQGVLVRWRTGSNLQFLGFRVYRGVGASRVSVGRLVPAWPTASGHTYSALDRSAPRAAAGLRYWLRATRTDGSTTWYGPIHVG